MVAGLRRGSEISQASKAAVLIRLSGIAPPFEKQAETTQDVADVRTIGRFRRCFLAVKKILCLDFDGVLHSAQKMANLPLQWDALQRSGSRF